MACLSVCGCVIARVIAMHWLCYINTGSTDLAQCINTIMHHSQVPRLLTGVYTCLRRTFSRQRHFEHRIHHFECAIHDF